MRISKLSVTWLVAALCALLPAARPASATVLRYVPFEEQVDSAAVIVVAVAAESQVLQQGGLIYTEYSFQVLESVKGDPATVVKVRVLGGELGRIGMSVDGAPKFKIGGRYVLFLEASYVPQVFRVLGFSQGSYIIGKSPVGEEQVVPQLAAESGLLKDGGVTGGGEALAGQSLSGFLSSIRVRLGKTEVRKPE